MHYLVPARELSCACVNRSSYRMANWFIAYLVPARELSCACVNRSSYRMANWFIASFQLWAARPQSAVMLRSASQIS